MYCALDEFQWISSLQIQSLLDKLILVLLFTLKTQLHLFCPSSKFSDNLCIDSRQRLQHELHRAISMQVQICMDSHSYIVREEKLFLYKIKLFLYRTPKKSCI